jgi:hypothetical protein
MHRCYSGRSGPNARPWARRLAPALAASGSVSFGALKSHSIGSVAFQRTAHRLRRSAHRGAVRRPARGCSTGISGFRGFPGIRRYWCGGRVLGLCLRAKTLTGPSLKPHVPLAVRMAVPGAASSPRRLDAFPPGMPAGQVSIRTLPSRSPLQALHRARDLNPPGRAVERAPGLPFAGDGCRDLGGSSPSCYARIADLVKLT